jgi:hypothetical protein
MKKIVLVAILVLLSLVSFSQYSFQEWHKGYLVTTEKDTLSGQINYSMETNSVTIQLPTDQVKAFSGYKLLYFEIFDQVLKSYRQFYTIPYKLKTQYETPVIFELLYEGSLSLVAREKIVQNTTTLNNWGMPGPQITQNVLEYDYFFLSQNGRIMRYTGSKNNLYEIMRDKKDLIKSFIKDNKLKPDVMRDLIRITSFYNAI